MKYLAITLLTLLSALVIGCADFTEGFENGIRMGQAIDSIR